MYFSCDSQQAGSFYYRSSGMECARVPAPALTALAYRSCHRTLRGQPTLADACTLVVRQLRMRVVRRNGDAIPEAGQLRAKRALPILVGVRRQVDYGFMSAMIEANPCHRPPGRVHR